VEGERCASIAQRRPLRLLQVPLQDWNEIGSRHFASTYREKKATMDELWRLAKVCRVVNVMRPYMESLI